MAISNEATILQESEDLVQHTLREFNVAESVKEDLLQEGRIGVLKAARSWQEGRAVQFRTYATTVVRNEMIDFLRLQRPVCASMDENLGATLANLGEPATLHDILGAPATQETDFFAKESLSSVHAAISRLSSATQREVVTRRLAGASVEEIARARGTEVRAAWKVIDEAIPNIRAALAVDD